RRGRGGGRSAAVASSIRVPRQAQSAALPARLRREEVAVAGPQVPARAKAAPTAQDQLSAHELAVVLAQGAVERPEPGPGRVGAGGPLPGVAEHLPGRVDG